MADKGIPTNRYRRLAKVGRAAATQAAKQTGTRAANVVRSEERSAIALEKRQVEAAEQIVTVLGTMKGAAMKLGQVLSFLDVGLVPEEYRDDFQKKLAKLRDAAPTVAFKDMRKVIEQDLGEKLGDAFADFREEPIAAVRRSCSAATARRAIPRCASSSSRTTSRWRARSPAATSPRGCRSRTSCRSLPSA